MGINCCEMKSFLNSGGIALRRYPGEHGCQTLGRVENQAFVEFLAEVEKQPLMRLATWWIWPRPRRLDAMGETEKAVQVVEKHV